MNTAPSTSTAQKAKPREDKVAFGIVLMSLAFLMFTLSDSSAKWLAGVGIAVVQVVFLRYFTHLVMSLVVFIPRYGLKVFKSNAPKIQVLRALFLFGSTVFNFLALKYLPITVTVAIFFAMPIVVCLLSIPMLGERIGIRRFLAIVVGFVGVLVILQPWDAQFEWALLASLAALFCASLYMVLTRMIAGVDDNPTGQLYTSGVATLLIVGFAIPVWTWPATILDTVIACLIGVFAGIGHSMVTVAHRYAEASTLAPIVYVQMLYVTVISWLVFSEPPDLWTLIGASIIIGSGLYIWLRERQLRKQPTPLAPNKSVDGTS